MTTSLTLDKFVMVTLENVFVFLYNVPWALKSFVEETDLDCLHLWGLDDRGLCCLDHSMHLHCLSIRQLHQGDGGGGVGVPCTHSHLYTG